MPTKRSSSLESILEKPGAGQELTDKNTKLRLVLISELELATKLSDPQVLNNVGETIKNYEGRVDALVINGGLPQVPNKYSKRRGERLDLLEDRLKEVYGGRAYNFVKGGKSGTDSVDSLEEAVRLANIQMRNIYTQAARKNIPIYYIFSENDYKNVESLISALEKIGAYFSRHVIEGKEEDELDRIKGVDPDLISFVQKSYKIKASQWKNKDKEGIKDVALKMYRQWVADVFSEDLGTKSANVKILDSEANFKTMKRLENDIDINGVKIRATHAVNGIYSGNNEAAPTERGTVMAIKNATKDAMHGRLPDIYLRSHESSTDFTAVDFNSKDHPVYFLSSGPLQDIDAQVKRHASWNKTTESKRVDQMEDSAMLIFSLGDDYRVELQHISFRALKEGTDISKIEKNADKELYETVQISDAHVGAPSLTSSYELMEAIPYELENSRIPKERRYLLSLGDMLHGGSDKASWTDILWPQRGTRSELIDKLKRAKTREDITEVFREALDGVATPDLGRQAREANDILWSRIAKYFDAALLWNGNHVEKAAGNAGESGFIGPALKNAGVKNVIYADDEARANRDIHLGPYTIFGMHSPGYRGGKDAGSALSDKVVNTGSDNVDMVFAGDCHEAHIKYSAKKSDDRWDTFLTLTSAALQDVTSFEKKIVSKPKYTRGFEFTYIPTNAKVGTSYIRNVFIPEHALRKTLKDHGGSELEKLVKSKYS